MEIFVDADGKGLLLTKDEKSIPVEKKISFDRYMRICWENSRTNMHYIDFCSKFKDTMKKMFKPVKISKNRVLPENKKQAAPTNTYNPQPGCKKSK